MNYYSDIADGYDKLYKEEQLEKLKIIKNYLKVKAPLLDIGAGTGISTIFFKVEAIALDPSEEMLAKYNGKKVCASAEDMPFEDNTFLTIISLTALHHTNIDKAIKEIKRVAKEGCQFAFTILKKAKNFEEVKNKLKNNFKLKEYDSKKDLILIGKFL